MLPIAIQCVAVILLCLAQVSASKWQFSVFYNYSDAVWQGCIYFFEAEQCFLILEVSDVKVAQALPCFLVSMKEVQILDQFLNWFLLSVLFFGNHNFPLSSAFILWVFLQNVFIDFKSFCEFSLAFKQHSFQSALLHTSSEVFSEFVETELCSRDLLAFQGCVEHCF